MSDKAEAKQETPQPVDSQQAAAKQELKRANDEIRARANQVLQNLGLYVQTGDDRYLGAAKVLAKGFEADIGNLK